MREEDKDILERDSDLYKYIQMPHGIWVRLELYKFKEDPRYPRRSFNGHRHYGLNDWDKRYHTCV